MWARRAIRFIHKKRNRCCDAAAKFFFTISLVCCCCCRKHTAHSLWKKHNHRIKDRRLFPLKCHWSDGSRLSWTSRHLRRLQGENKTSSNPKKEKGENVGKSFSLLAISERRKTFWRSVVNLCFDTFFFLFYYFPFFSFKKENNGCSIENDKLMAATVKDRKNTHGHGSFHDVQSAKLFLCVCVCWDGWKWAVFLKVNGLINFNEKKEKQFDEEKKTGTFHSENEMKEKREKVFLKNESIKRERFLTLPGNKKNLPKMNHFSSTNFRFTEFLISNFISPRQCPDYQKNGIFREKR